MSILNCHKKRTFLCVYFALIFIVCRTWISSKGMCLGVSPNLLSLTLLKTFQSKVFTGISLFSRSLQAGSTIFKFSLTGRVLRRILVQRVSWPLRRYYRAGKNEPGTNRSRDIKMPIYTGPPMTAVAVKN